MNILLTNDDGINAEGIKQLAAALKKKHNVYVAAPNGEYSGAGHSITFFNALSYEFREFPCGIDACAINGTPVDCVKFGLEIVFKDKNIDLVVSGVNNVLNLGTDVFYSGTVNAAIEATIIGKKAIAVSTMCCDGDYSFPSEFIAENLEKLAGYASKTVTVNVNIPSNKKEGNKGVAVAQVGIRHYNDAYKRITDQEGKCKYMLTGTPVSEIDSNQAHDVALSDKGYITVSPLTLFTTDFNMLEKMLKEGFEF